MKGHPKWFLLTDLSCLLLHFRDFKWNDAHTGNLSLLHPPPPPSRPRKNKGPSCSELVSSGFQGGKTFCASFCASLIAGSRRAFLCVDCVCLLLECWVKCTRCERLLRVKHFYLTCLLFFRRLKITLDSEQPMLKEKRIIPSVWGGIKGFWTFLKRRVFFWLCIRLIYELISPGWIKTRLYSVISSYGYFFYMPRFIYLCRTSFILVLCQRTVMLTLASEQTWTLKTSSEL